MVQLFGFEINRKTQPPVESFAPPVNDDGAVIVAAGGAYGTYIDLDGTARTESELVSKYREIALEADIERAVDDIVNEAIDIDAETVVEINLDKVKYGENVKNRIREEFQTIIELLNFENEAYDLFKRWYIDGRMYFHAIIDEKNPREGIKELRYIDPRKIRKIREVKKKSKGDTTVAFANREYYVYNERNFLPAGGNAGLPMDVGAVNGVKIAADSIVHVTSGLMDKNNAFVYSYLQKAIRPLNQLRTLEDATVIYRISRAPERRIFYIDVGNLPKIKAEQYLRDMMVKHKNRLVYDATTGEVRDDRKYMTMLEDYWLPRREGNRGTEITTLPAGQNLGEMADVTYFQQKLYQALNVPVSRLQSSSEVFSLGKATEISRDEVKFVKFVGRLRKRFSHLFLKTLEKQLVLKGIVSENDWTELSNQINFDYAIDSHFEEFKDTEILQSRLANLGEIQPYIGKYFSDEWVRKNVLHQTDKEIEDMIAQINAEGTNEPLPNTTVQPAAEPEDTEINIKTPTTGSSVPNIDGAGR
jgi:Bacteriophage T4-like portal protein (Gp20)